MNDFAYQPILSLGEDTTPYRLLSSEHVAVAEFQGKEVLLVEPEGLELLAEQGMKDIAHFLRPGHLAQLSKIFDDPEATPNDRFVAMELLKNANISSAGVLPMCQDTGTAIVMGKKGQFVFTEGDDAEALSKGICGTLRWLR